MRIEYNVNTTTIPAMVAGDSVRISIRVAFGKDYEMDELSTFIGSKSRRRWVVYAMRRDDKQVVDFRVGSRSNSTLRPVVGTLLLAEARRVYNNNLMQKSEG